MRRFSVFFALLVLVIALQACKSDDDRSDIILDQTDTDSESVSQEESLLGEDTGWQPLRRVQGEPLSEAELAELFARLPDLGEKEADQVEFLRRAESLPLPVTGDTVTAKWPPDISATAPGRSPEGPLQVQAFRPEGEVELPFQLAIAFDRPMVALGTVADRPVPEISISPEVPGRWRWIGTQTLSFQPTTGYPRATEFNVEVAAGARAVDGTTLTAPHRFSFATAPPKVVAIYPRHGNRATDQPILVVFDQPMHRDTGSKVVGEQEGRRIPMRVLRARAMETYFPAHKELVEEGRAFLLAPRVDYKENSSISIHVETPFRSLEGPRLGTETMNRTVRIRGPLEMVNLQCGWDNSCRPGEPFRAEFTNLLDEELNIEASQIQISPPVEDLRVTIYGNRLNIDGDFQPRTRYEVTLPETIKDTFGQYLEGNRSANLEVDPYEPFVTGPNRPMVVRPADGSITLPVTLAELESIRVRLHRVEPEDWTAFTRSNHRWGSPEPVPFEITHEETLSFTRQQREQRQELQIDLRPALEGAKHGHVVVLLDEPRGHISRNQQWIFWVQVTDLAVDLSDDGRELAVRVTRLSDGRPVQGATLSLDDTRMTTDAEGEGRFSLPGRSALVVENGSDTLFVPAGANLYGYRTWSPARELNNLLWSVLDDRQIYRPGETATFHGWIRSLRNLPDSDLEVPEMREVSYRVRAQRNNELSTGTAAIDAFGGFEITVEIPEGTNTGNAVLQIEAPSNFYNQVYIHSFQIQEFRRPEYEVKLNSDAGPHLALQSLRWEAEAAYYAGGALAQAPATWRFNESSGSYSPPGWSRYQFGAWSPWWRSYHSLHSGRSSRAGSGGSDFEVLTEELRDGLSDRQTDGAGRDIIVASLQEASTGLPRTVTATVSVQDVNRQAWEATDTVLVHPAAAYVGLRSETTFIQRDETFHLDMIAVDIDGAVAPGLPVEVELFRNRGWNATDSDAADSCETTSAAEPSRCSFANLLPGSYSLRAAVKDADGRSAKTEMTFWVAGQDRQGAQVAQEGELMLIPDGEEYAVGDTAKLFVQSSIYPLEAIVELRRDGRLERRLQRITAEEPLVEVELTEGMIPNVHVSVVAVSAGENYDVGSFFSGSINLPVSTATRRLTVEIEPSAPVLTPGAELGVQVAVKDHNGQPVSDAQVLLFAVDEALLALSAYTLRDVLGTFYPQREPATYDDRSRSWLILDQDTDSSPREENDVLETLNSDRVRIQAFGAAGGSAPVRQELREAPMARIGMGLGGGGEAAPAPAIAVREVFDALAFFRSDLRTNADGVVEINEKLPESLTRYRIMAVAVEGVRHFGTAETNVTARMPLMVRPSPPRFLNVGDEFEFPVVLQNQTEEELLVDVALRSSATLEMLDVPGMRVRVPASDRVEVRFPARAASAGQARIQAVATSGEYSDAAFSTLPVLTPATTEAFATYGSLSEEDLSLQALQVPQDVYSQFGGLDIQTSSTQLQALTDALLYLVVYPFTGAEQLASRILSVLALYDVLEAFNAPDLPSPDELRAHLTEWTTQLLRNQRSDGGFGFWINDKESRLFVSSHATLALWQAREAGIDVSPNPLRRATDFLTEMSRSSSRLESPRQRATVEAYALYVRFRMDEIEGSELDQIITRHGIETFSMEALGWLLPLAHDTQWKERILQRIQNQVQETSATAEFQETYDSGAFQLLHTSRRTDGVVLDGLLQTNPDHYLVEKVVRGLLAHRSRGRWSNTQENVFILMALKRYFDEYEADTPHFMARAWLGDLQIGEHQFRGRTTERYEMHVPMSFLHEGDAELPLVLQRDGQGRMYYRMGVRYAPKSRQMAAIDEGFLVDRTYHAVDNDDDVRRTDEGWIIRAGARVRVELTMTIPARRYHVALVDWLPAGFEPINTALATSQVESGLTGNARSQRRWWWGGRWYDHQNLRDERVELFSSFVGQGVYTYNHVVRATTPGDFVAMPAKAKEMYHPETFGRSSTERVRIIE